MKTKKKIRDERVEASKIAVFKETLYVLLVVFILSFGNDIYFLKQSIEGYIDELTYIAIAIAYIIERNLWLGNYVSISQTINKKVVLLSTFLTSFLGTLIFSVRNYYMCCDKYTGIFDGMFWIVVLLFFVEFFIITGIGFYFAARRELKKNIIIDE